MLVALAVLITATLTVSATHIGSMDTQELGSVFSDAQIMAEFKALAAAQKDAVDAYEILYDSFENLDAMTKIYPDNYGGAHIEDNILYIHIVDIDNQDLTPYQTLLADYLDDITFVDAEYSLETLTNSAEQYYYYLRAHGVNVISCGVLESDNVVTIGIEKEETPVLSYAAVQNAEAAFNQLTSFSHDVPVRFSSESRPTFCSGISGGSRLMNYSVGACGMYNGGPAIVLCGHGLSQGDELYTRNSDSSQGSLVGTVDYLQFAHNENGDYAIVPLEDDWSPLPRVGLYTVTGSMDAPPYGTYIGKYGAYGGSAYGISQGPNSNLICSFVIRTEDGFYEDWDIKGCIEVVIAVGTVEDGDSGGPVFVPANGNTMEAQFCGVVSSRYVNEFDPSGNITKFYFTPYLYIKQSGFTVSTGTLP